MIQYDIYIYIYVDSDLVIYTTTTARELYTANVKIAYRGFSDLRMV